MIEDTLRHAPAGIDRSRWFSFEPPNRSLVDSCDFVGLAGARQKPPQGRCVKPMWTSYGGWARSGGLPEGGTLPAVRGRLQRWTLPLAILILFSYPNPLVLPALAVVALSGVARLARRGLLVQA